MKVAVISDDFRTLTGKIEDARRFLLFEAQKGKRPQLEKYFELPIGLMGFHSSSTS